MVDKLKIFKVVNIVNTASLNCAESHDRWRYIGPSLLLEQYHVHELENIYNATQLIEANSVKPLLCGGGSDLYTLV